MKRLSFALGLLLLNVISFANPAAETPNTAEDYTFSVYNRWGQLLFQTTNPSEGWDGRAKNEFAAHDTYIYSIEYRFAEFPDPLVEYGSVALIR